jgi:hypothetical protein
VKIINKKEWHMPPNIKKKVFDFNEALIQNLKAAKSLYT